MLAAKSIKTKIAVFSMLKQLSVTWNPVIGKLLSTENFDVILPITLDNITSKNGNSSLKLEGLQFLNKLLQTHLINPATTKSFCSKHFNKLIPSIVNSIGDSWYKITTEVLHIIRTLVHHLNPVDPVSGMKIIDSSVDVKKYIVMLYDFIYPCLEGNDIDQEIKESSISAGGELLAVFGNELDKTKVSRAILV